MPKKVTRSVRKLSSLLLSRPRKRLPPQSRSKDVVNTSSTSGKKINLNTSQEIIENLQRHYRIVDFLLVFSAISTLVKCVKCNGKIDFKSCKKEGLGFAIKIECEHCKMPTFVPSCERIHGGSYEIKTRFIFVIRLLGLGLAGCEKFCGLMDLTSSFILTTTYNTYVEKIFKCAESVTKSYFATAIKEERKIMCEEKNLDETSDASIELCVSGDGTWKKRGFSSLFGVATIIGFYSGKLLDLSVKSAYCHCCKIWETKLETCEFEQWLEEHRNEGNCKTTHEGASGNMEVTAIIEMFNRSIESGVKYRNYIGDGDSKTYSGVVNSKPYGEDFIIYKKECVGHVQKRMGKRLRDLVKSNVVETTTAAGKKRKLKTLSVKGKLTGVIIDKLTVYYGLAIRRNSDSVEEMKKAIWATFYHYSSTDANPQHQNCPSGADSWCEWQKSAAKNELSTFKHNYNALPTNVLDALKPIYEDLSKDALLERCLGGFNQNNNESYNQLIWKMTPKTLGGCSTIVETCAYLAACIFNEGCFGLLCIMQNLGIKPGTSCHEYARQTDSNRIRRADQVAAEDSKEGRVRRRQQQRAALDDICDSSVLYGAGIDDSMYLNCI